MKLRDLHLGRRYPPLFGRVSLWLALLMAFELTMQLTDPLYWGVRVGAVTVAGFLPESVRSNPHLLLPLWWIFAICALLWALNWAIPISSWGATLAFFFYVSLYLDNITFPLHECHLTTLVLFVYCAWYQFYWREIRVAIKRGDFWTTPLYPRWVYSTCLFAICWSYFLPGVSKLIEGQGFLWADGLTLQLWILARGQHEGWLGALVVAHRSLARLLQVSGLAFELTFPLALVFPRFRLIAGLFITAFHLANVFLLDVDFVANTVVLWTFFYLWPLFERYDDVILARFTRHFAAAETSQSDLPTSCA